MCKLTEKEVKILEAMIEHVNYTEAALSLKMDPGTYRTYLSRIRRKVRTAQRFLIRMRRYHKDLFKREMKIEVVKPARTPKVETEEEAETEWNVQ
jgi:DNA-binding CsgD family transcriptional regulator